MIIDLHMHSHYSPDGRCSIPELLNMFSKGDIAGLTDHETIAGWEEFEQEAKKRGIKPVLGIEWFADECHILAYFLNSVPKRFYEFMEKRRSIEESCMRDILYETLRRKFPKLAPYDEVLALRAHPEKILGKPALTDAVIEASKIDRAKTRNLVTKEKKKIPLDLRPEPFYPNEIIEKIIEWGAVPVLAHPYRNFGGKAGRQDKKVVEKRIRELTKSGIKGIDVYSWNSTQSELDHLIELCDELKLVPVIGSDFHHQTKGLNPNDLNALDKTLIKRVNEWLKNGAMKIA